MNFNRVAKRSDSHTNYAAYAILFKWGRTSLGEYQAGVTVF